MRTVFEQKEERPTIRIPLACKGLWFVVCGGGLVGGAEFTEERPTIRIPLACKGLWFVVCGGGLVGGAWCNFFYWSLVCPDVCYNQRFKRKFWGGSFCGWIFTVASNSKSCGHFEVKHDFIFEPTNSSCIERSCVFH
eukprot:g20577.t1